MYKLAIGLTVISVVLVGLLVYSQQRREPLHVSGFIEADEIRVGSRVGGRVKEVLIKEGDQVSVGLPLVKFEPFDLQEQASEARALVAQRRAELDRLKNGNRLEDINQAEQRVQQLKAVLQKAKNGPREQEIRTSEANRDQAQAQLTLAIDRHRRIEGLRAKGASTPEELDQATSELKVARATLQAREEELSLMKAGTRPEEIDEAEAKFRESEFALQLMKAGSRAEDVAEGEAALKAAEAALKVVDEQLAELTVKSPVNGTVEALDLREGDLVGANTPAISILDGSRLWVRAYVPENRMGIKVGQKVTISTDSFPGKRFGAHISYVSRQAEFTPGNVQTPEERSKQVFRIKVELDEGLGALRAGMNADVWLGGEEKPD